MYGADVDAYDGDKAKYWLLSDTQKPTAAMLGIGFTCQQQRNVVQKLEALPTATEYIMGLHMGDVDGGLLNEVTEIIDLMYEYPAVFYLDTLIDDMHNKTVGTRVRHKDIVSQFSVALNEMQDSGILFASPPP